MDNWSKKGVSLTLSPINKEKAAKRKVQKKTLQKVQENLNSESGLHFPSVWHD